MCERRNLYRGPTSSGCWTWCAPTAGTPSSLWNTITFHSDCTPQRFSLMTPRFLSTTSFSEPASPRHAWWDIPLGRSWPLVCTSCIQRLASILTSCYLLGSMCAAFSSTSSFLCALESSVHLQSNIGQDTVGSAHMVASCMNFTISGSSCFSVLILF